MAVQVSHSDVPELSVDLLQTVNDESLSNLNLKLRSVLPFHQVVVKCKLNPDIAVGGFVDSRNVFV